MSSHYKSNKSSSGSDKRREENLAHSSRDNPVHKNDQVKGRSENIQRLIKEKESKKDATLREEKEKKERVEKQQNTFRIPKKKPEPPIDVKRLISSLFDDSDIPNGQPDKSDQKGLASVVNGNSEEHVRLSGSATANHKDSQEKSSDRKSLQSSNNHKTSSEHRHSNSDVKSEIKSKNDHQSSDSSKHEHHRSSKSNHEQSHHSSDGHRSDSSKNTHKTNHEHSHHSSEDHKSDSSKHRHKSDPESSHNSSKDHKSDSSKHGHKSDRESAHNSSKDHKSDSSKHRHESDRESSHHSIKDHKSHGSSDVSREHKSYDASFSSTTTSSTTTSSHRHKSSHHSKSRSSEHSVKGSTSPKTKETTSSLPKPESTSSVAPPQSSSSSSSKPELKSASASVLSSPPHPQLSTSDQQPVILTKHHLNPTVERQANEILSEKEKILARLAAIKQRTLEAIHKESSGKRKRSSGDKSHRKSKAEVKMDDKAKSVEIIKEVASSDEEEEINNGVPSALDIMLSERNAKLEKEKIARMAKQAWERAMKKDKGEGDEEVKIKKKKVFKGDKSSSKNHHKSESSKIHSNHKKKEHSLSPPPKPKKRPIVRHSAHSAPPPIDFKTILEMAERKQKEPKKPVIEVQIKKKEEDKRPLTQDEKDRIEWKKSKEYQDWLKFGGPPPGKKNENSDEDIDDDDDDEATSRNILGKQEITKHTSGSGSQNISSSSLKSFSKNDKNSVHLHGKPRADVRNPQKNITVNENVLVCGPGGSSEDEASLKKSQNPFDRIMSQFQKRKAPQSQTAVPGKRIHLEDSEEEDEDYDSDLDNFIDDGEEDEPNISAEIKKIFNYDKSKYKNERDDDLSDMEADFATVMKEEKRSAKLGLMEDLEDMRKEQEELRRKALMKKRK